MLRTTAFTSSSCAARRPAVARHLRNATFSPGRFQPLATCRSFVRFWHHASQTYSEVSAETRSSRRSDSLTNE